MLLLAYGTVYRKKKSNGSQFTHFAKLPNTISRPLQKSEIYTNFILQKYSGCFYRESVFLDQQILSTNNSENG